MAQLPWQRKECSLSKSQFNHIHLKWDFSLENNIALEIWALITPLGKFAATGHNEMVHELRCAARPRDCRDYRVCNHCGFSYWCCNEMKRGKKRKSDPDICHCALHVWIDGCCLGNGHGGATCGYGIWFADDNPHNVADGFVPGEQTNQRAELYAALKAIELCTKLAEQGDYSQGIIIHTDSKYVVGCMTTWLDKWRDNGYRSFKGTEVVNRDLIEELSDLLEESIYEILPAHIERRFNTGADKLSKMGANGEEIEMCFSAY